MEFNKMTVVVLIVAFCALVSADRVFDDDAEIDLPGIMIPHGIDSPEPANDDPKPCCLPSKWQGNVTGESGFSSGGRGESAEDEEDNRRGRPHRRGGFDSRTTMVYYDGDSKKVTGRSRCCNDTCGFLVVFGDNNTADIYLYKMAAQKCWSHKSNRAVFHKQCIPENATFGGAVKVGPADKGLDANLWNFRVSPHRNGSRHGGIFVSGRALVTGDNCSPVLFQNHGIIRRGPRPHSTELKFQSNKVRQEDDYDDEEANRRGRGRGGGGFMGSAFFTNFEASIKDPSVFDKPSYCNSTITLQIGEDMDFPDILDRFVTLN